MKKIDDLNYYELLNLTEDAAVPDIHKAYFFAISTYSMDSLAAYNILPEEDRMGMLKRIENAYTTLVDKNKRLTYDEEVLKIKRDGNFQDKNISAVERQGILTSQDGNNGAEKGEDKNIFKLTESAVFGGAHLKSIREMKGITLDEISKKTRIKVSYLKALEDEDFGQLPAEVFSRGFLRAYAKYLSLDPEIIGRNYKLRKK
ncbi:MAG: helix-turn-helix domain-containing protein [Nitrospinota bacterium]